jgi:hypothetical protein
MTPCRQRVRRLVALVVLAITLGAHPSSASWPPSRSPASAQDAPPPALIEPALITTTVESLGTVVKREYIDPDLGAKVEATLRRSLAGGRFTDASTAETLATMLSRDLYEVTHDKHLVVEVVRRAPGASPPTAIQSDEARALGAQRANYGVRRVEILPGNVGYLDLSTFYRPEEAREAIAAAMKLLSHADALILDMRRNGGGSPGTVALLMSYFLDEPGVGLFEIAHREPEAADLYATESMPLPERDSRRPVHILTSARTFSAGEGLAYLLQERHRAEVVGETTAGAANPGKSYPVNDRFSVTVPNGRVRSAIGGGNWEATGVVPDVTTTAAEALEVAYARALRTLIARQTPGPWRDALQQLLANPQVKE